MSKPEIKYYEPKKRFNILLGWDIFRNRSEKQSAIRCVAEPINLYSLKNN